MQPMNTHRVIDIIVPLQTALPSHPGIGPLEPITRAVELMAEHGLKRIAVIHNRRIIGMVEFNQALEYIGLKRESHS